ncbi:MAG: type 4a pilus biogenesis protein PilO [Microgenomates group bacterium]|jgi:Tfp pilus assembly protein PilO
MADSRYSRYYVYIKPVITNKYVRSFAPYIFSLLALIIFTIFAIRPTVLTIIELQKSIQDNQKVLAVLQKKSEDLTNGKRNLDNLDQEIKNKINAKLPTNPAVTNLINNLQTSATNSASVSALQIQPVTIYKNTSDPTGKLTLEELVFSFNTQGAYSQLTTVIDNVTKASRYLNLTSVVLSRSGEGGITLSISGKGYYLKE